MVYKRYRKPAGTSSKAAGTHKGYGSTARSNVSNSNAESSPGFETPASRSYKISNQARNVPFSKLGSAAPTSSEHSSPGPFSLQRKRVSLRRPSPYATRNSTSTSVSGEPPDESETEEDIRRREDADAMNEVIMAIDMKERGTLGCAYYIARDEKLFMMEDIRMAGMDIVDTLKLHAQPTILLISSRADETLEKHLSKEARPISRGDDDNSIYGLYVLDSRPSREFQFEAAQNKLVNLDLDLGTGSHILFTTPSDDIITEAPYGQAPHESGAGRQGRLMRLAGWVDLDSRLTVGCSGAVLSYLQRRKSVEYLPGDEAALVAFRVRTIEMFALSDTMFINADTLASLQILQSEFHPNSHMQGPNKSASGSKESLSIFGLFYHLAYTPQGKRKLRQMFLRPSLDLPIIEERQFTISVLLRPDNSSALENLIKSLKKVKNIRTVVIHLQKGISGISAKGSKVEKGVWANLQQFTFHTLKIIEAVSELVDGQRLVIVNKCLETLQPFALKQIGQWITGTVDFARSAEQHRSAIMQGVDVELDNMKRTYDGLGDLLSEIATQLANDLPEWSRKYIENCVFFPQLGFLTAVPLDATTGKGKYEGEGTRDDVWDMRFITDNMAYYKNSRMTETDLYFGDMYGMICDKEIEIIHDLAVKVLEHEALLVSASDICGELDSLVALAQGAQRYNLVPAKMTTENVIDIKQGRHPLQELTIPSYVANDAFLHGGQGSTKCSADLLEFPSVDLQIPINDEPSLLLMTGPNYSGKSVYLKQIALTVYMAHLGSFVPAESATIGLTDKILTRIATLESVSKDQSAFMIDLQQIALAIKLATNRSLVIIDEFGKGTKSSDGAGLACGVFEYLLNLGAERPKVLGATHFHEIFESGHLEDRPELTFGHMEVRVDNEAELVDDQITYLHNFVSGRSLSSFGTCCAALSGIDPAIIERAEQLILLSALGNDLVAACSLLSESATKDLEDAEQVARQFLEQDLPWTNETQVDVDNMRRMMQDILTVVP